MTSQNEITLSIDAMGGDEGAEIIIPALALYIKRQPKTKFLLYGDEKILQDLLKNYAELENKISIEHCDISIAMDEKPSQALRRGRWRSSMWKALEAVKKGEADACISAGNTGALMAMARFCLRTMADIDRPAIAAIWPTSKGESIVLDVGATVGADAQQLIDFAILGGAMSRAVFGIEKPTIGLLNIGVEEVKGIDEIKTAGKILKDTQLSTLDYKGFIEGSDIGKGDVNVVVTEGFSGNIALKTAEGTARQIGGYLKDAMKRSLRSKLGYLFAKPAFDALRKKMDPRSVNGGVFLGLNGIVVKSHGGTDALGFASALELGYEMARHEISKKIEHDLMCFHGGNIKEMTQNITKIEE